jgi:hypothetical protein
VSTFTWLDTSEADRRQALDVIDAFRERDTRDELGLGAIRDGLADLLFPGTTTIQTRARYLLFIPWIYLGLEDARIRSAHVARRARAAEIALIAPLAAEGREGVIGITARAELKRLPSEIYWQGLGAWGIRLYPGSRDQYHRSLDAYYRRVADGRRTDDGDLAAGQRPNWHAGLPAPPADFPEAASMRFRSEEQDYLRDRIVQRFPDSFLAFLVRREPWKATAFAWHHPDVGEAPEHNRVELHHAQSFSELIHGPQLLYNLMLAEKLSDAERRQHYLDRLQSWSDLVARSWDAREEWMRTELDDFWQLLTTARVGVHTRAFVETWLATLAELGPHEAVAAAEARDLIRAREVRLKRKLARLENPTSLTMWGGAAGASQLDLRWRISQQLVLDILAPPSDVNA